MKYVIQNEKGGVWDKAIMHSFMCQKIYSCKYKSHGLVLPNVFIVSYRIAKCRREIVSNKGEV